MKKKVIFFQVTINNKSAGQPAQAKEDMKPALLDRDGKVIGQVWDAPEKGNTIEIAGCFTAAGDPVNVKEYKISRSKRNMAKAEYEQPVVKSGRVWTFHSVSSEKPFISSGALEEMSLLK